MTEQELRALVREALARHLGSSSEGPTHLPPAAAPRVHASHGMLALAAGADTEGVCLIEPSVMCNHCGYCKSLGH
jgi:hypothetical protein